MTCFRVISSNAAEASVPEHQRDRPDGKLIRKRDRNQLEPELAQDQELLTLFTRAPGFLDVADLERSQIAPWRPVKRLVDGGEILPVGAMDRVEDQCDNPRPTG